MNKGIIGKKIGMTQIFDEKGNVIPVTVIETAGNIVSQIKTVETDGYNAVQLGFGDVKESKVNKPVKGHFAKSKLALKKYLREFRMDSVEEVKVVLTCATTHGPASITVTGITFPFSSNICVIPTFFPIIAFFIVYFLLTIGL